MSNSSPAQGAPLPRGTVTFLLSDVEGSTRLYEQYPEAMRLAMARHDAIFEQHVSANSGKLIKPRGEGDSRFAVFPRASDAVAAARDIQRAFAVEPWDTPSPVRVRIALHTGEAELQERDYYGSEVNRSARLRALAYGGQVLLSQATYVLIRDALPAGVGVRDLGEHRLKDLQRPEHTFQLVLAGVPSDFPPLKSLDALPNNLPPQLTSFIGRQRELNEIKDLLGRVQMLTLTGPGGTGKTRLSLQAGAEIADQFKDGAWFVDLSALADPAGVLQAIARALGVRDSGERPVGEVLQDYLSDKELLLILDNFEQVIAAAPFVRDLLVHAPRVKFLVTSRILLRVSGEQGYEVPQFSLPDPKHLPPLEQLSQYDAVRLFIERARAYKPDWTITNENAPAVAEICYRLDALPLAIELAAARVRLLPPSKMLAQLDNRLDFLKSPARDLPARQQTLRGAIEWSYNLLSVEEQSLFCRLAVFAGGATLDAVEAVCGAGNGGDILARLEALIDNSLIRQRDNGGEPRFVMLETIREYGAAQLELNPEDHDKTRRSHAAYFADLTVSQWTHLISEQRESALSRLTDDLENIRAAWRYWVPERNLEQLGKFADSLLLLNDARGWYQATVDLTSDLLRVLSSTESTPDRVREEVALQMSLARALMIIKGYYAPEAEQAFARALELCEQEGDTPQLFPILRGLSRFYVYRGDFDKAGRIGERILSLAMQLGDTSMEIEGNLVIATHLSNSNPRAGLAHLDAAITSYKSNPAQLHRLSSGANPAVVSLTTSALVLWMLGLPERARERAGEAVALAQTLDHPFSFTYAHFHAGLCHLWLREPETARAHAESVLHIAGEHDFQVWSAVGVCLRGAALADLHSPEEGLALLRRGVTAYQGLRTPPVFFPLLLFLTAGACGLAKQTEEGIKLLDQASQIFGGASDLSITFLAMFSRLKGQLMLQMSPTRFDEAERCFQQSLKIATDLEASMLELRAATSLSRLWREQGKTEQGRQLLRTAYEKLTEGFTMADLAEAKALLDDLA